MSRRLALLLVLLLSLQWSSSAIAALCMHERDTQTSHLGHHVHSHVAGADKAAADTHAAATDAAKVRADTHGPAGDLQPHQDCAGCHFAAVPALPAQAALALTWPTGSGLLPALADRLASRSADSPYRPPRA